MSTYTLMPHSNDEGFDIAVVTDNGSKHILLGFESKAVAEGWIASDKRQSPTEQHDYHRTLD